MYHDTVYVTIHAKTSLVCIHTEINFIGPANSYAYKVPTHHVCYGQIQEVCFSGGDL